MRLKKQHLALLIPILLLTQAFACNQQKTAQQILNKVAVSNQAFARVVIVLHTEGTLTDDQERQFLGWSKSIAQEGNSASAAFLAGDNATVLAQINLAVGTIDDALTNGLAGVKNQTKKDQLHAILLGIRGLFTSAEAFIPGGAQ